MNSVCTAMNMVLSRRTPGVMLHVGVCAHVMPNPCSLPMLVEPTVLEVSWLNHILLKLSTVRCSTCTSNRAKNQRNYCLLCAYPAAYIVILPVHALLELVLPYNKLIVIDNVGIFPPPHMLMKWSQGSSSHAYPYRLFGYEDLLSSILASSTCTLWCGSPGSLLVYSSAVCNCVGLLPEVLWWPGLCTCGRPHVVCLLRIYTTEPLHVHVMGSKEAICFLSFSLIFLVFLPAGKSRY